MAPQESLFPLLSINWFREGKKIFKYGQKKTVMCSMKLSERNESEGGHSHWVKEGLLAKEIMEDVNRIHSIWFNEVDKR